MRRPALLVGALVLPLLVPTASQATSGAAKADLVVKSAHASTAGSAVTVAVTIANTGAKAAKASVLRLQLSNGATLGIARVPGIAVHKSKAVTAHGAVPAGTAGGTYTVIACADTTRKVKERNERNNCRRTGAIAVAGPVVTQSSPSTTPTHSSSPSPSPSPTGGTPTYSGPDQSVIDAMTTALPYLQPYDAAGLDAPAADRFSQSVTYEDVEPATKTIGAAGGDLQLTDAHGNTMTLHVPANALLKETTISATPIASSSLPGTPIGARFEPSGLVFDKPATLTIVPTSGIHQHTLPITSNADGSATGLAVLDPDPSVIRLIVSHFTDFQIQVNFGDGISGSLDLSAYETWIGSQERAALTKARDDAIDSGDPADLSAFVALMEQQYTQEIAPLMQVTDGDCDAYRSEFDRALSWGHNAATLDEAGFALQTSAITTSLGTGLENCWRDDVDRCQTMSTFQQALSDLRQLSVLSSTTHSLDELHWCHPLNGVVTVTDKADTASSYTNLSIGSTTSWSATYFVSADAYQSGTALHTTGTTETTVQAGATYRYHYTNTSSYPCENTRRGSGSLGPVPVNYQLYMQFPGPGMWAPTYGPVFSFPTSAPEFKVPVTGSAGCFSDLFTPVRIDYTADISGAYTQPAYQLTLGPTGQITAHQDLSRSTNNGTNQYDDSVDVEMTMNDYSSVT